MKKPWMTPVMLVALWCVAQAQSAPTSMKPLIDRMTQAGRAEARVVVSTLDPSGSGMTQRGTMVLEPPDRIRLDYGAAGERLTARSDGGEWLQPRLRQMIVMDAGQAAQAAALWDVLRSGSAGFAERKLGPRSYRLVVTSAVAETVHVTVGADRFPSKIETQVGDTRWTIQFSGWRFSPARGREAFVLKAPAGFETIELP